MNSSAYTPSPSKKRRDAPRPFYQSLLIISPFIIGFFVLGIYLGSTTVAQSADHGSLSNVVTSGEFPDSVTEGLPGTKNVLTVRDQHVRSSIGEESRPAVIVERDRSISKSIKNINTPVEPEPVHTVTKSFRGASKRDKSVASRSSESTSRGSNLRGAAQNCNPHYLTYLTRQYDHHSRNIPCNWFESHDSHHAFGQWKYCGGGLDLFGCGHSTNDIDMRTIFTNKAAGCDNHPEQYGLSLYERMAAA